MVLRKERPLCHVENVSSGVMNNEQPVSKRQRIEGLNGSSDPEDPSINHQPLVSSDSKSNNNHISHVIPTAPDKDEPDHVVVRILETAEAERLGFADHVKSQKPARTIHHEDYWEPIHNKLLGQCLCGVNDDVLQRPLQNHSFATWPHARTIPYLSSLQLLFEVYLKQCRLGKVCARIKDIFDGLAMNESMVINEIIELSDNSNQYVQYLAGRVISTFLIIVQDSSPDSETPRSPLSLQDSPPGSPHDNSSESSPNICDEWLEKLIDNMLTEDELDEVATRRISFSLEVFKQLLEWKKVEAHPLDEDCDADTEEEILSPVQQPPIENNYFNFYSEYGTNQVSIVQNSNRLNAGVLNSPIGNSYLASTSSASSSASSACQNPPPNGPDGTYCQFVWHYEFLDTFKLRRFKRETVKYLENKWPTFFRKITDLNVSFGPNASFNENLNLTFLELWKIIISGANGKESFLSITDTRPFYTQLDCFEMDALNQDLPPRIYMQRLDLFNAVLCYGDSLALQDNSPDDPPQTCNLANRIINHVHVNSLRDLLNSVPIRSMDNPVSIIGYAGRSIDSTMRHPENYSRLADGPSVPAAPASYCIDKRFLQSMVLLVLKSVAVSVREMRSDSSDSSMDSDSSDSFIDSNNAQTYADYRMKERTIRPVLKTLDLFAKEKLQLHPDNHFSKTLVKLFIDQDDIMVEAMLCTLDVAIAFTFRRNRGDEPTFEQLIRLLDPVYTFIEFLNVIAMSWDLLLNYLISNETCFLGYFFRFLEYITKDWWHFELSCREFGNVYGMRNVCDEVMTVLHDLRLEISRMLANETFPYDIVPIKELLETCESLHGDDL